MPSRTFESGRRHDKIRKTFLSEKVADRGQEIADRGQEKLPIADIDIS